MVAADDFIKSDRIYVIDCRSQAYRSCGVYGSRFKLVRQFRPRRALFGNVFNHFTAAQKRRHRFKQFPSAVQNADTHRRTHLVSAECKKIGSDSLHINLKMRNRLRAVNNDDRSVFMRRLCNLFYGIRNTEHVAHVCYGDKFCAFVDFV